MKTLGISLIACSFVFAACGKTEKEQPRKTPPKTRPNIAKKLVKSTAKPKTSAKTDKGKHLGKPWHAGSVEQAMAEAKRDNKPVFLYWGAVWCPPCNLIKAEVFSHPSFAGEMTKFVSVYLDGDTERAQAWGEKLKVSGYPTLLFLNPAGNEVLRLSAGLTWAEFKATTDNVIATMKPVAEIIALAKAGKAKTGDWQLLASVTSYGLKTRGKKPAEIVDTLHWIANAIPAKMVEERAMAAANLLSAAATTKDKTAAAKLKQIKGETKRYVEATLATEKTQKAAREMILYSSAEVVSFVFDDAKAKDFAKNRDAFIERWLAASRGLRKHEDLPVVVRMDTLWPEVELFRLRSPKGDVPAELRKRVVDTVNTDVAKLTSAYLRKAGVSGATALLRRVGAFDEGRKLLDNELKTTTTPWYYMSSYATLEKKAGNTKAALAWAQKARLAAKGGATKLQWIANDLSMTSTLATASKDKRMTGLVKSFYDLLLQLPDGFFGRNQRVATKVGKIVKKWKARATVKPMLTGYAARCKAVAKNHQPKCKKHFEALLAAGKS